MVVLRWVRSLELADDGPRAGLEAILDGSLISTPAPSPADALGAGVAGTAGDGASGAKYSPSPSPSQAGLASFSGGGGTFGNLSMPGGNPLGGDIGAGTGGGTAGADAAAGDRLNMGASDIMQVPPFACPIRSLLLTANERHLIVGDEEGNLRVLVQDSDYLRDRLQRKLIEIGILD